MWLIRLHNQLVTFNMLADVPRFCDGLQQALHRDDCYAN